MEDIQELISHKKLQTTKSMTRLWLTSTNSKRQISVGILTSNIQKFWFETLVESNKQWSEFQKEIIYYKFKSICLMLAIEEIIGQDHQLHYNICFICIDDLTHLFHQVAGTTHLDLNLYPIICI